LNTGVYISGAGHALLIIWALFGGLFFRPSPPLPVQTTEVALISAQEFAALTVPDTAPEVPVTTPDMAPAPAPEQAAVPATASLDVRPPTPPTPAVKAPKTETQPSAPAEPSTSAEVADTPPEPLASPVEATIAPQTLPDAPPSPAAAPRVAPTPAPPPPPDATIADIVTPQAAPDPAAAQPTPEEPPTAPEQAAPVIVTEAKKPSAAKMLASIRPKLRPARPPTPKPAKPKQDSKPAANATENAVAAALAAAIGGSNQPPARVASGPPLTRGEKDALRIAVERCWNTGSLSSEALRTTVVVAVQMNPDGTPQNGSIRMLSYHGGSKAAAAKAFGAARRAIIRCGARGFNLPAEKFSQWQDIEMTFNPEKMRIK